MGVLGESNRLTDNERADLIEAAVGVSNDVDGDFPIVVGTRRDPFNSSPNGGQCDFVRPPARTIHPRGAYV